MARYKFLDGRNFDESTAEELVAYLFQLSEDFTDGDRTAFRIY
jgi:hypothetical protein